MQCSDIGRHKTEANLRSVTVNAKSNSFSFGTMAYVGISSSEAGAQVSVGLRIGYEPLIEVSRISVFF